MEPLRRHGYAWPRMSDPFISAPTADQLLADKLKQTSNAIRHTVAAFAQLCIDQSAEADNARADMLESIHSLAFLLIATCGKSDV